MGHAHIAQRKHMDYGDSDLQTDKGITKEEEHT